jgi:long-chain acyl-CoA synthetase
MKEFIYHRLLLPAVSRNADRPCTTNVATGFSITYAEHLDRVSRLIGGLQGLGLERTDRFAVLARNSPEYLQLFHAGFLGGGVVNPLNIRFAAKELVHVLRDSETRTCFVEAAFAPVIDAIRVEAGLEHVVLIGQGDVPHTSTFDELLATGTSVIPDEGEETDPAVLVYTGGTTGMPKGVLHDQRAMILSAYHVMMAIPQGPDTVTLVQTPMFHATAIPSAVRGPARGAHLVILPMFEPKAVMEAIEAYRPTTTTMVPTMIGLTMAHPDFRPERLAGLRELAYAGSPMPKALLETLLSLYPDMDIWQAYGMTEAFGVVTLLGPEEHRRGGRYLQSVGLPVMGVELSVQDPSGRPVPTGETGEICVRGANFMVGYWRQPEATAVAFRDGWYHTGDAGYLDADGYLFLMDRVKDMVVTGGENVYSVEVENALAGHPAVQQVAVIGIPDDRWGEAVHAVVVLRAGQVVGEEELKAHARQSIAGYKAPKTIEFRSEPLPLSGAMKVLKRELRAPYWADRERAIN